MLSNKIKAIRAGMKKCKEIYPTDDIAGTNYEQTALQDVSNKRNEQGHFRLNRGHSSREQGHFRWETARDTCHDSRSAWLYFVGILADIQHIVAGQQDDFMRDILGGNKDILGGCPFLKPP